MKRKKLQKIHIPQSAGGQTGSPGFALIATISVMVLMVMIALAMLTLSSIELRSSRNTQHQQEAQANARMALMIAIGELQKYAGPDQRVTANAEIVFPGNGNSKWVGVWSTTALEDPAKPMVGANTDLSSPDPATYTEPNLDYLTDRRNLDPDLNADKWKTKLRLAWLVSGDPDQAVTPEISAARPHITLVEKSAGLSGKTTPDPQLDRVTAPYVKLLPSGQGHGGGYAYWVGDESQKARINQKTTDKAPDLTDPTNGGMARLAGTEGPNFRNVKDGLDYMRFVSKWASVAPANQIAEMFSISASTVRNYDQAVLEEDTPPPNFDDTRAEGIKCGLRRRPKES